MKVKVLIKSEQIFDDHKEQEEHICDGEIQYLKNGIVLEFVEKFEQQELHFKMNILKEKVIINRQNQAMILDYNKDDNCKVATPYGIMKMKVHTTNIKITNKQELIQELLLEYDISLENNIQYGNRVIIKLEY